jgi:pimeloyl-ACP methyl ester carboxylesterase
VSFDAAGCLTLSAGPREDAPETIARALEEIEQSLGRLMTAKRPTCVFLPGILAPAAVRYAALIRELGRHARAYAKELEVYAVSPPAADYAIADEVDGLLRWARRLDLDRFHLYGHSGGGAVALAFTAVHPELVQSLTLDEAAFDFSDEMRDDLREHRELQPLLLEDPGQAMPRFLRLELKQGVEFTPPAGGAPPLPNRPAGIASLLRAFDAHELDLDALRRFRQPVLYTRGSLSVERYERSARRLAQLFPDFREVVFEGLHHLNTSNQAEPARVAALLLELWSEPAAASA